MSVDQEVLTEREQAEPVSTATVIAYAIFGVLLTSWFLFIWLVVQKGFVDSVGEVAGIGFALLLLVAIVGSVRRNGR
ncbi:hypothetical protein [Micromonospora endophytica]|uniref:Uncharacterized protein n=1 Tax=Micromonospora endophytica TaxID=515350 RepID=A0A2W2D8J4_9ACTN|nr:hypothetical protein [Micromonospora endophytica]PZF97049.1 hypothetical protein C1I93_13010 [Micromonospora endophytica]RIW40962.1 hypothetical protein D3H59_27585 [Micromonospora endophytica]BCJ58915.1 hypothetical protein Jiend_23370 [Micromonospora endophytica]